MPERRTSALPSDALVLEWRAIPEALDAASLLRAPWHALAKGAVEPSPACEPEVLLPAFQHLADRRQGALLLVWNHGGRLKAVLPLAAARPTLTRRAATLWNPPLLPPLVPLVAADGAEATVSALVGGLRAHGFSGLALDRSIFGGPFGAALIQATGGVPMPRVIPGETRPVPRATIEAVRQPAALRDAVEDLLVLDARTARPDRPALIHDPRQASALRAATRSMAARRRCRVERIRANGETIAAALILGAGSDSRLWLAAHRPDADGIAALAALLAALPHEAPEEPGETILAFDPPRPAIRRLRARFAHLAAAAPRLLTPRRAGAAG
ncbi:MAG TPA: GNAT family N-acetyltransferase [Beijerinckiaceae bacterium]|jgi:hypothetical protein